MSKQHFNRGLRFGALVGSLTAALRVVKELQLYRDLLTEQDGRAVADMCDRLIGIEQRAWDRARAEVEVVEKRKR